MSEGKGMKKEEDSVENKQVGARKNKSKEKET